LEPAFDEREVRLGVGGTTITNAGFAGAAERRRSSPDGRWLPQSNGAQPRVPVPDTETSSASGSGTSRGGVGGSDVLLTLDMTSDA
jgi:hypothetical protein